MKRLLIFFFLIVSPIFGEDTDEKRIEIDENVQRIVEKFSKKEGESPRKIRYIAVIEWVPVRQSVPTRSFNYSSGCRT